MNNVANFQNRLVEINQERRNDSFLREDNSSPLNNHLSEFKSQDLWDTKPINENIKNNSSERKDAFLCEPIIIKEIPDEIFAEHIEKLNYLKLSKIHEHLNNNQRRKLCVALKEATFSSNNKYTQYLNTKEKYNELNQHFTVYGKKNKARTEELAANLLDQKNTKHILKHCSYRSQIEFLAGKNFRWGPSYLPLEISQLKLKFLKDSSYDVQNAIANKAPDKFFQHCMGSIQRYLAKERPDKFLQHCSKGMQIDFVNVNSDNLKYCFPNVQRDFVKKNIDKLKYCIFTVQRHFANENPDNLQYCSPNVQKEFANKDQDKFLQHCNARVQHMVRMEKKIKHLLQINTENKK